jgi:hypothetical protein
LAYLPNGCLHLRILIGYLPFALVHLPNPFVYLPNQFRHHPPLLKKPGCGLAQVFIFAILG